MRLLCDRNVARQYTDAFVAAPDIHAVTVSDALDPRAADEDIATYAAENDYVVFTGDADFFALSETCGCIVYHQERDPPVGDVLEGIRQIRDSYTDYSGVVEVVPGDWA